MCTAEYSSSATAWHTHSIFFFVAAAAALAANVGSSNSAPRCTSACRGALAAMALKLGGSLLLFFFLSFFLLPAEACVVDKE